jgi:hypothetical protein
MCAVQGAAFSGSQWTKGYKLLKLTQLHSLRDKLGHNELTWPPDTQWTHMDADQPVKLKYSPETKERGCKNAQRYNAHCKPSWIIGLVKTEYNFGQ